MGGSQASPVYISVTEGGAGKADATCRRGRPSLPPGAPPSSRCALWVMDPEGRGSEGMTPCPRRARAASFGGLNMVPESGRDSGSAFDPGWPFCGAHDSPHFFLRPYMPLIWSLPGTDTSARTLLPASVPTRVLGASSRAGPLLFWPCIDLLVHRPASRSSLASLVTSHVEG